MPPAALTGAIFLARKIFRATAGTIESDVFMAGISVIPTGILLLFSGVLGIANIEVTAVIAVFALSVPSSSCSPDQPASPGLHKFSSPCRPSHHPGRRMDLEDHLRGLAVTDSITERRIQK